MPDPLLSSLCRICNTNRPKYRCPRCSSQTCSLACSKRHKIWSECNGIRDPTVYKPRHELATPAGIDHDYNFIANIERSIERSDRLIIEEKGLVHRRELFGNGRNLANARHRGGAGLGWALQRSRVIVEKAPSGMQRNKDNSTNWSKAHACLNWQVEWVREDGSQILGKIMETQPIGEAYANLLEEERRGNMTAEERKKTKKRKAAEIRSKEREAKKAKLDDSRIPMHQAALQNPESSAWDVVIPSGQEDPGKDSSIGAYLDSSFPSSYELYPASSGSYFYLHRPHTPSSKQKVLIPLHPSAPLSTILQNRVVLEFPTIYAFSSQPASLPEAYVREDQYLDKQPRGPSHHVSNDLNEEGSSDSEDSETEEGEIV